MSEQLKALGERIRETRKEKGLTQLELAEKVKISPTYMSEIELGKSNFGVETLIRISEELQVSTDWLIRAAVPEVNAIYQNEIHMRSFAGFIKQTVVCNRRLRVHRRSSNRKCQLRQVLSAITHTVTFFLCFP